MGNRNIGLRLDWECKFCGNITTTRTFASSLKTLKSGLIGPGRCPCGSKIPMIIKKIQQVEYEEREVKL